MNEIVLLILFCIYQAIAAFYDYKDIGKYETAAVLERDRVKYYKETIVWEWIPCIFLAILFFFQVISLQEVGIKGIDFSGSSLMSYAVLIIMLIITVVLLIQMGLYLFSAKHREEMRKHFDDQVYKNRYDMVVSKILIPRSKREKIWYLFVSLSAGICEELIWRGLLLHLLFSIFPNATSFIIIGIAAILFGLAHAYQGLYGVIKTSVIAVLFVLLYIITDSLLPGMLIHFFFDFSSAFILSEDD